MGELETSETDAMQHFASSARAGRRNALPVIEFQTEIADEGAAKLADRLSDLTAHCDDQSKSQNPSNQPSTSTSEQKT